MSKCETKQKEKFFRLQLAFLDVESLACRVELVYPVGFPDLSYLRILGADAFERRKI